MKNPTAKQLVAALTEKKLNASHLVPAYVLGSSDVVVPISFEREVRIYRNRETRRWDVRVGRNRLGSADSVLGVLALVRAALC